MAVSIDALRGYGGRRVTLQCSEGSFDGSIVSDALSEHSVVLLFALNDDPHEPIVIGIDTIANVVER